MSKQAHKVVPEELRKRYRAAYDEILTHQGETTLWHMVSEDARALHWAWHLENHFKANPVCRIRSIPTGPADSKAGHVVVEQLMPNASAFWIEMTSEGVRSIGGQEIDLNDLPPSFTDPIDDKPARHRPVEEIKEYLGDDMPAMPTTDLIAKSVKESLKA